MLVNCLRALEAGETTSSWCEGSYQRAGLVGFYSSLCQRCDSCHTRSATFVNTGASHTNKVMKPISASGSKAQRIPSRSRSRRTERPADTPEEQLTHLLVDLPSEVARAVCDLGVETCIDFRGLWSSAEECVSEVESILGYDLAPGVAFQLARLWTMARREVEGQVTAAVAAVVQFRNSSLGTRPEPPPRAVAPVAPASNRIRPIGPMVVRDPGHVGPFTAEAASRQMKLEALFRLALNHILNLEELGIPPCLLQRGFPFSAWACWCPPSGGG